MTAYILLKNNSPVPKTPRKYSIEAIATVLVSLKKLKIFRKSERNKK
jgi:hypothetical protein